MLATGGVSEPASAGVSGLATGGVCELASGGVSGLAGGKAARAGALLRRLNTLVTAVREAMAARPQLPLPLTKNALAALEVAIKSELRLRRKVPRETALGARWTRHGTRKKRKPFCKGTVKSLQTAVTRREERIAELEAQLGSETTAKGRGGDDHCRVVDAVRFGGSHCVLALLSAEFQRHPGARFDSGEPDDD